MFVSRFVSRSRALTVSNPVNSHFIFDTGQFFPVIWLKCMDKFPFLSCFLAKYCIKVLTATNFTLTNIRRKNRSSMWSRDVTRVNIIVLSAATQRHQFCCLTLRFRIRLCTCNLQVMYLWFCVSWNSLLKYTHLGVPPYNERWYKPRNCQASVLADWRHRNWHERVEERLQQSRIWSPGRFSSRPHTDNGRRNKTLCSAYDLPKAFRPLPDSCAGRGYLLSSHLNFRRLIPLCTSRRGCICVHFSKTHLFHRKAVEVTKKCGCTKNKKVIMIKDDGKFNIWYKFLASVYCLVFREISVRARCILVYGTLLIRSTSHASWVRC